MKLRCVIIGFEAAIIHGDCHLFHVSRDEYEMWGLRYLDGFINQWTRKENLIGWFNYV